MSTFDSHALQEVLTFIARRHAIMRMIARASINVTLHDKTKHDALTTDFELRPPLPTITFELLLLQI